MTDDRQLAALLKPLETARLLDRPENGTMRDSIALLSGLLSRYEAREIAAAVQEHLRASRFWPKPAELVVLCDDARERGRGPAPVPSLTTETGDAPTRAELWEMAAFCASRPLPACGRCDGGGKVTDDEDELTLAQFYAARGSLSSTSRTWKDCPAGCLSGRARPSDEQVRAQLREQFGVERPPKVANFRQKQKGEN
jgi:hypothetical protein